MEKFSESDCYKIDSVPSKIGSWITIRIARNCCELQNTLLNWFPCNFINQRIFISRVFSSHDQFLASKYTSTIRWIVSEFYTRFGCSNKTKDRLLKDEWTRSDYEAVTYRENIYCQLVLGPTSAGKFNKSNKIWMFSWSEIIFRASCCHGSGT